MFLKLLAAKVASDKATHEYYDSWSHSERLRVVMELAWLQVRRLLMLLFMMESLADAVGDSQSRPKAFCMRWATACMMKERWRYTSIGLRLWTHPSLLC